MKVVRSFGLVLALVLGIAAIPNTADAGPGVSSLTSAAVAVYGAKWCSACRALESGLKDRKIAFDSIDVDNDPAAFARARNTAGVGNAIPLTGVVRSNGTVWIVGADVDAVDRAQRGD